MSDKNLVITEQVNSLTQKEQATVLRAIFDKALDTSKVENLSDAEYILNSSSTIDNRLDLAKCKVYKKIYLNKWYMPKYKNFDSYILARYGVKKAQAYNLLKVADYVNEEGNATTLPHGDIDFTTTQVLKIISYFNNEENKVKILTACENGDIRPSMSVSEIQAYIKKLTKLGDEIPEENAEIISEEKKEEKAENKAEKDSKKADKEIEDSLIYREVIRLVKGYFETHKPQLTKPYNKVSIKIDIE